MALAQTYRSVVRELARDNFGYVTTREAKEAGVPGVELAKLAARGGLENVAYGVYRVLDVPPDPLDEFAEALIRVGPGARLLGESVLAVHGLGNVNPRRIMVGTPRRARPRLPEQVEVQRVSSGDPVQYFEGLACQPLTEAFVQCRGRIPRDTLVHAARDARSAGMLTGAQWRTLGKELRS